MIIDLARVNRDYVLYYRRARTIDREWRERHNKVMSLSPAYRRPCPAELEQEHLALWRRFRRVVCLDTLRVCFNISGRGDPRIIPEEIFAGEIERCLNPTPWPLLLAHKSFYTRFFSSQLFPENLLHNIEGIFYDERLEPLADEDVPHALRRFPYPVILKPNSDSGGDRGISFPADAAELARAMSGRRNFVVQRVLRQHPFFESFNGHGLNTLRVYTYKSVVSGKVHVLNATMRMGKGGSLDNETDGGIACSIHPDGRMNTYAVDKYGQRFDRHPDTGLVFAEQRMIPQFDGMRELVTSLAARLPTARLAGWDVTLGPDGRWRCVEVNLQWHTIRFAQYAGNPFFGDFTEEVVRYCLAHPRLRRANIQIS